MFRLPTTLNLTGRRKTRDRLDGGSALNVCHRPYLLLVWNYKPAVRGLAIACREHRGLSLNALGLVSTHAPPPPHGRNAPSVILERGACGPLGVSRQSLNAFNSSSDEEITKQNAPLARRPSGAL